MSEENMPQRGYAIGVMSIDVEGKNADRFQRLVEQAMTAFESALAQALGLRVELLAFAGPHLAPTGGAYAPLDFLRIGLTEKLERQVQFLLIVTEVDLAASTFSYTLSLPSPLTNVGVISTKRLDPAFWGNAADEARVVQRLTTLLLHTFGHLLNLPHTDSADNAMHTVAKVSDLDAMGQLTQAQREQMRCALPREAHERTTRNQQGRFALRMLLLNWRSIAQAVLRANPLRLVMQLPTMITAALSVIIIVFFSAEIWDVGSTVAFCQLALFSIVAVLGATAVLYRSFAFGGLLGRGRVLSESAVVTGAATALCLLLTMLLLFTVFVGLTYLGTATVFPKKLMETWPTVDPAVRAIDHLKLGLFVAALGLMAGSLGGRADSKNLMHQVLFVDEKT